MRNDVTIQLPDTTNNFKTGLIEDNNLKIILLGYSGIKSTWLGIWWPDNKE